MRLVSRFGYAANQIRRDRPLTHEELMHLSLIHIFHITGVILAVIQGKSLPGILQLWLQHESVIGQ